MRENLLPRSFAGFTAVVTAALCFGAAATARGQLPEVYRVELHDQDDRNLEMVEKTTRVLQLSNKIKRAQVIDEHIVDLVFLETPNQIQLIAQAPGITTVSLLDENDQVHVVNVTVDGDSRQLNRAIERFFPAASVKAIAIRGSVLLTGLVNSPEEAEAITQITGLFYPENARVINNIEVGGERQVMLRVKIMQISRSKLRALGFNWQYFGLTGSKTGNIASSIGELIAESADETTFAAGESQFTFGVFGQNAEFLGVFEALRRENMVKILAEPNLTAISGRSASFLVGGEFPYQISQGFGQPPAIEFKPFGTRLDFVPIVMGNGRIRLEVQPEVSEIDEQTVGTSTAPALSVQRVNTAVELAAGETLVIAGMISTRDASTTQKVPFVGELPGIGTFFRRVRYAEEEIELVVVVTPELVAGLEPAEVPPMGPGDESEIPNDVELMWRGLPEVQSTQSYLIEQPPVDVGRASVQSLSTSSAAARGEGRPAANGAGSKLSFQRVHKSIARPHRPVSATPSGSKVARTRAEARRSSTVRGSRSPQVVPAGGRLRLLGPTGYDTSP